MKGTVYINPRGEYARMAQTGFGNGFRVQFTKDINNASFVTREHLSCKGVKEVLKQCIPLQAVETRTVTLLGVQDGR